MAWEPPWFPRLGCRSAQQQYSQADAGEQQNPAEQGTRSHQKGAESVLRNFLVPFHPCCQAYGHADLLDRKISDRDLPFLIVILLASCEPPRLLIAFEAAQLSPETFVADSRGLRDDQ